MWDLITPRRVSTPGMGLSRLAIAAANSSTTNPFDGLEAAQGCEHDSPMVRDIANRASAQQEKCLSGSVLIDVDNLPSLPSMNSTILEAWMADTIKIGELGLLISPRGDRISQYQRSGTSPEVVAGLRKEDFEILRQQNASLTPVRGPHHRTLETLIRCPSGGIIFETGAGQDWERIKQLSLYAKKRKASLICHDVLPISAQASANAGIEVPYIALPPHSQFLGRLFASQKANVPKVMTMKNVLSSLSFESLIDLFIAAEKIGISRIVMTQTNSPATSSPILRSVAPIFNLVASNLDGSAFENDPRAKAAIDLHFQTTFSHLAAEVVTRAVTHLATRRFEYRAAARYLEYQEVILDEGQAIQHLNSCLPNHLKAFRDGVFNVFIDSPFGGRAYFQASTPQGRLKLGYYIAHVVLEKNSPKLPPSRSGLIRLDEREPLTPLPFRQNASHEECSPRGLGKGLGLMLFLDEINWANNPFLCVCANPRVKRHLTEAFKLGQEVPDTPFF